MKAVNALVDTLASCGVKHVFGLPGNSLLEATDYMLESGSMEFVTVRHEQVAAGMAEGFARVTGKPGVCVSGLGPSAANLVIGIANAFRASSPVLAITGDISRQKSGREAFNEWNQLDVFKPITKLSIQVSDPKYIANQAKLALLTCISGRPGPVQLNVPEDVGLAEVKKAPKPNGLTLEPTRVSPRTEDVQTALNMLKASGCPLIIAGGGAVWAQADSALRELVEILGIPFILSSSSRGLIHEDHPLCFGVTGVWGWSAANDLVRESDLILTLGFNFGDDETLDWTLVPDDAKIIQVDIDPSELGKHYDLDLGILADINSFVKELLSLVRKEARLQAWSQGKLGDFQDALRKQREEFYVSSKFEEMPVDKKVIIREVMKLASPNAIITCGTGTHARFVSRLLMKEPRCLHKSGGFAQMGFAFPAAMGAKIARPDRQVICLDGDGDFMMTLQDLETAVRMKLNVVTVIFNNGSYGAYWDLRTKSRKSVEFRNPDFVKLAESFGAVGIDVNRSVDFGPALQKMLKADVPSIINATVSNFSELPWPVGKH